jgi:lipopolysaccharide/colanic/teichoic acid biosynthesis glycosyltransferase
MYPLVKRAFDVVTALVLLILLAPMLLPLMLALLCTGEGVVFYKQQRIGYQQHVFFIWKFATMLRDSPNMGTGSLTLRNDPRVTPLGRWLRRTKINELPQLWNLLRGDMTLVGPRPQVSIDFETYSPEIRDILGQMRPGITGIGSIVFRDEERHLSVPGRDPRQFYSNQIAPYKGALERWYFQHRSLKVDFLLLWLTGWAVLFPETSAYFTVFPNLPPLPEALALPGRPH